MRKYLLAAAATAALTCFAAPAMAQTCTGDGGELTMNPDGTTTCGSQGGSQVLEFTTAYGEPAIVEIDPITEISVPDGGYVEVTIEFQQRPGQPAPGPVTGKSKPKQPADEKTFTDRMFEALKDATDKLDNVSLDVSWQGSSKSFYPNGQPKEITGARGSIKVGQPARN